MVLENEDCLAIEDIHPQAPAHILIIPKKHIADVASARSADAELIGKLILAANAVAIKLDLQAKGFRLIINQGEDGGQMVPHLHVHLLGGKKLGSKIVHDKEG